MTNGIFSIGKAYPDNNIEGWRNMKDVRTACCCVEQKAEIVIPIPEAVMRNSMKDAKKNQSEPLKGTS